MKKIPCAVLLFGFILSWLFSASSPSLAIMKGLSTEELTHASDIVISGEVENTETQWSKDGSTIVTSADIAVDTVIRGMVTPKKITVEYEGGEV